MSSTSPRREKLDVESSDDRDTRLGNLLSSISQTQRNSPPPTSAQPLNPAGPSRPFAVPQSDVLARARAFLPLFQASNEELLARAAENPDSVDMEKSQADEKVIAMDLGLGVFDAPANPSGDLGPIVDSIPPHQSDDLDSDDGSGESDGDIDIRHGAAGMPPSEVDRSAESRDGDGDSDSDETSTSSDSDSDNDER